MKKNEIKILDKLWSKAVHLKGKERCECCSKSAKVTRLNACHVIGRRHRATRWGAWFGNKDEASYTLCGFCGCYDCHKQYDEHGPREAYIREKVIGLEEYESIRVRATQTVAKNQDFEEIKNDLEDVIRKYT